MSGSDPSVRTSSGGAGGAGGTGGGKDDCIEQFRTVLGSPVPDVVQQLSEDDLLDIVKVDTPIRGVIAQTLDGKMAGAITRDIAQLRRCLDRDVEYEAIVIQVTGGSVTVEVRKR